MNYRPYGSLGSYGMGSGASLEEGVSQSRSLYVAC